MKKDDLSLGVSKSYQRSLVLKCAFVFIVGVMLTTLIFFLSVHQKLGSSYQESFNILSHLRQEVFVQSILIYTSTLVLIAGGIILITLLYSHRVVGPMYRLGKVVSNISAGDFSGKVVLRKKDAIQPLAEELNNLLAEYRETINDITIKVKEFKELSENISNETDSAGPEDSFSNLAGKAKELEGIVEKIKL